MAKIEPGCYCMVYGLVQDTQYNGLVVRVMFHVEHGDSQVIGGLMHIYMASGWLVEHDSFDWGHELFLARNLMRLDDDDDLTLTVDDLAPYRVTEPTA